MSGTINRRNALKAIGLGAAGLALAGNAHASAQSGKGKLVIASFFPSDQIKPLVAAIQDATGLTVDWRNLTSERYVESFSAAEASGDQIDLMYMNGQDLRRFALGGKLKDLSATSYRSRFQQVGLQTYTVQSKLWGLPVGGISGFPFFYNKKLIDTIGSKEPQTYTDLRALQPELKKLGATVVTQPGKNIYLWPVWYFWAFGQTSGNRGPEMTFKTLAGEMKFTDDLHLEALEIIYQFARDGMFVDSVVSNDDNAAWNIFTQGKGLIFYHHSSWLGTFRAGKFPNCDISVMPPVLAVADKKVKRNLPGGSGNPLGIYSKIAPEREGAARMAVDLISSDRWVKFGNDVNKDAVSTNVRVKASTDPVALKYARDCAPNQITYLDWFYPPELTRAFQENIQALIVDTKKPNEAAAAIQKVFDGLVKDGYKFVK